MIRTCACCGQPVSADAYRVGRLLMRPQDFQTFLLPTGQDGEPEAITLSPNERRLLELLMRRPGVTRTYDMIADFLELWDFDHKNVISGIVHRVRRAIGDAASLECDWGVGYRIVEWRPATPRSYPRRRINAGRPSS